jgi:hypothetical protein
MGRLPVPDAGDALAWGRGVLLVVLVVAAVVVLLVVLR